MCMDCSCISILLIHYAENMWTLDYMQDAHTPEAMHFGLLRFSMFEISELPALTDPTIHTRSYFAASKHKIFM